MTVYNPLANYKYLTICKEFWPSQNQRDRKCHSNIGRRFRALTVRWYPRSARTVDVRLSERFCLLPLTYGMLT